MRVESSRPVTLVDHPAPRVPWSKRLTILATIALALLAGVGAWLFAPSDLGELQPPPNLESYEHVDGVMARVDLPILKLNAYSQVDGSDQLTFHVREADLRYFDVVHLRAHSSIGLPTRLYYEREGGKLWAVYKEDAPANSGGGE